MTKQYKIIRHGNELNIYPDYDTMRGLAKGFTYFSYERRYEILCAVLDLMTPYDDWVRPAAYEVRVYLLGEDEFNAIIGG